MEFDVNETARRLQQAMSYRNISAVDLAERSGVAIASISQFTHARGRPSQKSAHKLGKTLEVNPLWLLGYDVPMDQFSSIENLSTPAAHLFRSSERFAPVTELIARRTLKACFL